MKSRGFHERLNHSAQDFVTGVQPILERELNITVLPVEELQVGELGKRLDQAGIDAFYYNERGEMRGLASRLNYSDFAARRPAFTFRYALFDSGKNDWDYNREFSRKLAAATVPEEFNLFPRLHVESFGRSKGAGEIGWSFAAETRDIVTFIDRNLDNPDRVRVFTPKFGERRQVVSIDVEMFARDNKVIELVGKAAIRTR